MHQRIADLIVAWRFAEPADAVILVYLLIAWVAVMGCGLVAWWKGFYGGTEDPDWIGDNGMRRNR